MKGSVWIKRLIFLSLVVVVFGFAYGYKLYHKAFAPNIFTADGKETYLYIPTGSNYSDVILIVQEMKIVRHMEWFEWTAEKKQLGERIRPGRYRIENKMSSNNLVNQLRSGHQAPVKVTFNNIRTLRQLAEKISIQIEPSADSLLYYLQSPKIQSKFGFNEYTMAGMFIPNTYEFFWNTSCQQLMDRFNSEYQKFWNKGRLTKAKEIGLSPAEVISLAAIVNEETRNNNEKPVVAGVYMNRLAIGMRLQADPTIIYALGDFSIQRVLKKHYEIDSPYNTYKYSGLPPGPICIPEISSIDAVLNYDKHKYLYFCAKPDFSGNHNFARTLTEHNQNAALYRRELNKRKIYR